MTTPLSSEQQARLQEIEKRWVLTPIGALPSSRTQDDLTRDFAFLLDLVKQLLEQEKNCRHSWNLHTCHDTQEALQLQLKEKDAEIAQLKKFLLDEEALADKYAHNCSTQAGEIAKLKADLATTNALAKSYLEVLNARDAEIKKLREGIVEADEYMNYDVYGGCAAFEAWRKKYLVPSTTPQA